jgi:CubicO group peptidase (beta-lactamase class C family)
MTRIKILVVLSFLSCICFGQQQNQVKLLDSIFTTLNEQNQFNGSVLIAEKGKIIFEKGYGYSNEETKQRNNPETIFELASCSKQFTAAAIVLLKGKLKYEDKITKYLPELTFWDDVTIYELLRHTSGLPHFMSDMPTGQPRSKIITNEDVIRFYATRKDTLLFTPKSRHQYCNTNYVLLASIVERLSGKSLADFLSENIFKPLAMTNTFVYNRREHPGKIKNLATGYVWPINSFTKVISEDPRLQDSSVYFFDGVVGPAKVNSTVEDLYKWIIALKNNTLFTQKEFDEMTEVTQTITGKNIAYGFGFDLSKADNKFSFGHTGNWDGFVSLISQNMIKDRTIIILENFKMGVFPFDNITQILEDKPIVAKYKKKIILSENSIKKYTGIYLNEQNAEEEHILTYLDGHLIYNSKSMPWDMRFFPVAANEFAAIRSNGADGMLQFTTSADGTTNLEMLQNGKVIGTGVMKKSDR